MCVYIYICMYCHTHICVSMYVCVYIYIYMFVYICMYACLWATRRPATSRAHHPHTKTP